MNNFELPAGKCSIESKVQHFFFVQLQSMNAQRSSMGEVRLAVQSVIRVGYYIYKNFRILQLKHYHCIFLLQCIYNQSLLSVSAGQSCDSSVTCSDELQNLVLFNLCVCMPASIEKYRRYTSLHHLHDLTHALSV